MFEFLGGCVKKYSGLSQQFRKSQMCQVTSILFCMLLIVSKNVI